MVLKGVSQKVIEVVHTDNRYFEKAILFLASRRSGERRWRAYFSCCNGLYLSIEFACTVGFGQAWPARIR